MTCALRERLLADPDSLTVEDIREAERYINELGFKIQAHSGWYMDFNKTCCPGMALASYLTESDPLTLIKEWKQHDCLGVPEFFQAKTDITSGYWWQIGGGFDKMPLCQNNVTWFMVGRTFADQEIRKNLVPPTQEYRNGSSS